MEGVSSPGAIFKFTGPVLKAIFFFGAHLPLSPHSLPSLSVIFNFPALTLFFILTFSPPFFLTLFFSPSFFPSLSFL